MFPKKNRISEPKAFHVLAKRGMEWRSPSLTFRFLKKSAPPPQFAIKVSAKMFKKAVLRNRLRRRVAEALQGNLAHLKKPILALVIPRSQALEKPFSDLNDEVVQFFNHLNTDAK